MGHQNVKHAACAALRFGQEHPPCVQSALRRFVGDGGAAVGPLKGSARAIATGREEWRDRQVAKEISQLQVGRRIQSVGTQNRRRGFGVPTRVGFFGTPGFGTRL
jgi:hypothetical protein